MKKKQVLADGIWWDSLSDFLICLCQTVTQDLQYDAEKLGRPNNMHPYTDSGIICTPEQEFFREV